MIYNLSARLQVQDFADVPSTKALIIDLENDFAVARSAGCILCVLSHHATDEEAHIFPAVAEVRAKLINELISDHHDFSRRELEIAKAGHELLALERADDRVAAGIELNAAANGLFGAYMVHLNREEAEVVPLMRQHFSDAEMGAMQGKIIAGMPPDRLFGILGWMASSLNASELSALIASIRRGAPPALLKAVVDLWGAKVDPGRWAAVKLRTGV